LAETRKNCEDTPGQTFQGKFPRGKKFPKGKWVFGHQNSRENLKEMEKNGMGFKFRFLKVDGPKFEFGENPAGP